jgi:TonB family protein
MSVEIPKEAYWQPLPARRPSEVHMLQNINDWYKQHPKTIKILKNIGLILALLIVYTRFDIFNGLNWLGTAGLYGATLLHLLLLIGGSLFLIHKGRRLRTTFGEMDFTGKFENIATIIFCLLCTIILPVYLLITADLLDLPHKPQTDKLYITGFKNLVSHTRNHTFTHKFLNFKNASGESILDVEIPLLEIYQPKNCRIVLNAWNNFGKTTTLSATVTYYPHAEIISKIIFEPEDIKPTLKGTVERPLLVSIQPYHPWLAKKLGISGQVPVVVSVNEEGYVETATIPFGSGSKILDKAALETAKTAVFAVMHDDQGKPQEFTTRVIVEY